MSSAPSPNQSPANRNQPVEAIAIALAFFGALAMIAGTWALAAPEALAQLGQTLLDDPMPRTSVVLVLWTAFLTVAIYLTSRWDRLRWWEAAAGWLLVIWLWSAEMLLLYAPRPQFRELLGPALASQAVLRTASLISLLGGVTLLWLAFALWPLPQRRTGRRVHRSLSARAPTRP